MKTHIALVRGINVGGNKMVKMVELRKMLGEIGLESPETLLQSGNMVFSTELTSRSEIEDLLKKESQDRLGFSAEHFVRTLAEWDDIIANNPFKEEEKSDPSHLLVTLLKTEVDPKEVEAVQAAIKGPEQMRAGKEMIYTTYPDGIGDSKIGSTPGWKSLAGSGTARNWNTVLKLADLVRK